MLIFTNLVCRYNGFVRNENDTMVNAIQIWTKVFLLFCVLSTASFANLVFSHNDTTVFSVNNNGVMSFVAPPATGGATAVSGGLVITHNDTVKLAAYGTQVAITGSFVESSSDTSNWLMLRNTTTGLRTAITDEGDIQGDEPSLVRVDMYVEDHVVEQDIEAGTINEYSNFGQGRIDYTSQGATIRFYLKDHLGSTRAVINQDGSWAEIMAYDAYGAIIKYEKNIAQSDPTKERFTGKEYDTSGYVDGLATGMKLDYFGSRYYDPEIGTWASCDAAGQFFDPFAYSSNPIIGIDKDGNWFVIDDVIASVVGAVCGAYTAYKTGKNILAGAAIGSVVGEVSLLTGGVASGFVSGLFASGSAFGAVAGGIAGGAASGFVSGFTNSVAFGGQQGFFTGNVINALKVGGYSSAVGGIIGGVTAAADQLMGDKVAYKNTINGVKNQQTGKTEQIVLDPTKKSFWGHDWKLLKSASDKYGIKVAYGVSWKTVLNEGLTGGVIQAMPSIFSPSINAYLLSDPSKQKASLSGSTPAGDEDIFGQKFNNNIKYNFNFQADPHWLDFLSYF